MAPSGRSLSAAEDDDEDETARMVRGEAEGEEEKSAVRDGGSGGRGIEMYGSPYEV